ncbi:unnamed protein product, partial [Discosporangium mesarthrocarpum]
GDARASPASTSSGSKAMGDLSPGSSGRPTSAGSVVDPRLSSRPGRGWGSFGPAVPGLN